MTYGPRNSEEREVKEHLERLKRAGGKAHACIPEPVLPDIGDLAKAIQLALAPAFLLSGIGALLNVMTAGLPKSSIGPERSPKAA